MVLQIQILARLRSQPARLEAFETDCASSAAAVGQCQPARPHLIEGQRCSRSFTVERKPLSSCR